MAHAEKGIHAFSYAEDITGDLHLCRSPMKAFCSEPESSLGMNISSDMLTWSTTVKIKNTCECRILQNISVAITIKSASGTKKQL